MSIVGYARVSKEDQKPELQVDALKAAGCERIWVDRISGSLEDRPELSKALNYLRDGDTLVVWKLDRLGRSLKHLITLAQDLQDRGIGFRSLQEGMDTTTPNGRLLFHFFGAIAEFEREIIRERTKAGLAAGRARGRKGGRKPKMVGSKLEAARDMYASRKFTIAEIAKAVGVSPSTVQRHLNVQSRLPESPPLAVEA